MHNVTVAFAALLVMLLSYFFGCFNGSFMVSHFIIRDDVRKHGSGNAGLTNFYRTYGAKYALLVIACDMGKTVAACLLGSFFFRCLGWDGTLGTLLAGLGCELGHIFPVFYGFRGGKGILSGGTLVLLLNWAGGRRGMGAVPAAVARHPIRLAGLHHRHLQRPHHRVLRLCAQLALHRSMSGGGGSGGLVSSGKYPAPSPRNGEKIQVARQPHGGQGSASIRERK